MRVAIIAMTALLCVACAQQDRQAAPMSSDVGSVSAVPTATAESQDAAGAGEGYASRAPGEQAQADGPALASLKMATTVCVENLSSITPLVTFTTYEEQLGEGPLKYRSSACATGSKVWVRDVAGRIAVPSPHEPMVFWAKNPPIGSPDAGLLQERYGDHADCIRYVYYPIGDRRTWDDGLLMYTMEREPDGVGKVFRLTIRDSSNVPADGTPARCPAKYDGR